MQKSQKVLIGLGAGVLALGAVVAIAGPAIYRDYIAAPAADAPSLQASEGTLEADGSGDASGDDDAASFDPELAAGTWHISDGSEAGYRVDEVLNGTDVTVTGRTDDVSGTLTISSGGDALESAEFTVDIATIATDSDKRDAYFRDEALDAEQYPEATFSVTDAVDLDSGIAAGDIVTVEVPGELTIAGVTNTVTASVEVRSDGTTTELAGSIPIVFADYGVEAPDLGFVQVEPEGFVEYQLTATKAS